MNLFDKKQQLSQGPKNKGQTIKKDSTGPETKKIFTGGDVKARLSKPDLFTKYGITREESNELAQRLTDFKKVGHYLEQEDAKRFKKEFEAERYKTTDSSKRVKIEKQIRILKDLFGA